jgi:hypothetical protein
VDGVVGFVITYSAWRDGVCLLCVLVGQMAGGGAYGQAGSELKHLDRIVPPCCLSDGQPGVASGCFDSFRNRNVVDPWRYDAVALHQCYDAPLVAAEVRLIAGLVWMLSVAFAIWTHVLKKDLISVYQGFRTEGYDGMDKRLKGETT